MWLRCECPPSELHLLVELLLDQKFGAFVVRLDEPNNAGVPSAVGQPHHQLEQVPDDVEPKPPPALPRTRALLRPLPPPPLRTELPLQPIAPATMVPRGGIDWSYIC